MIGPFGNINRRHFFFLSETAKLLEPKTIQDEPLIQLYLFPLVNVKTFSIFSWQPVIDYIDSKYDEYLNSESRVNRTTMPDTRVHTCCYFIAPTGHG